MGIAHDRERIVRQTGGATQRGLETRRLDSPRLASESVCKSGVKRIVKLVGGFIPVAGPLLVEALDFGCDLYDEVDEMVKETKAALNDALEGVMDAADITDDLGDMNLGIDFTDITADLPPELADKVQGKLDNMKEQLEQQVKAQVE